MTPASGATSHDPVQKTRGSAGARNPTSGFSHSRLPTKKRASPGWGRSEITIGVARSGQSREPGFAEGKVASPSMAPSRTTSSRLVPSSSSRTRWIDMGP